MAMTQRLLPISVFALLLAAIPFIPGMPPFWIVLLNTIGLAALVAMGLVLRSLAAPAVEEEKD